MPYFGIPGLGAGRGRPLPQIPPGYLPMQPQGMPGVDQTMPVDPSMITAIPELALQDPSAFMAQVPGLGRGSQMGVDPTMWQQQQSFAPPFPPGLQRRGIGFGGGGGLGGGGFGSGQGNK